MIYYFLNLFFYPAVTRKPLRLCTEHCCVQTRFGVANSLLLAVAQRIFTSSLQPGRGNIHCFRLVPHCNVFFKLQCIKTLTNLFTATFIFFQRNHKHVSSSSSCLLIFGLNGIGLSCLKINQPFLDSDQSKLNFSQMLIYQKLLAKYEKLPFSLLRCSTKECDIIDSNYNAKSQTQSYGFSCNVIAIYTQSCQVRTTT